MSPSPRADSPPPTDSPPRPAPTPLLRAGLSSSNADVFSRVPRDDRLETAARAILYADSRGWGSGAPLLEARLGALLALPHVHARYQVFVVPRLDLSEIGVQPRPRAASPSRTPPSAAAGRRLLRAGLDTSHPDIFARLPRDAALLRAARRILLTDCGDERELDFAIVLHALLALPFSCAELRVSVRHQLNLAHVQVCRRGARVHDDALHLHAIDTGVRPRLPRRLATAPSAASAWTAAQIGPRVPSLSFAATIDQRPPVRYTASATVEIRTEPAEASSGLVETIFNVAQLHALTRAQMGLYVFRTGFVRLFALSPRLVAVEQLRGVDALPAGRQTADAFLDWLDATSGTSRLPWNLRAGPGATEDAVDWDSVQVLGAFAVAAWTQLLDLPAVAPLPPFVPLAPGKLAALGLADMGGAHGKRKRKRRTTRTGSQSRNAAAKRRRGGSGRARGPVVDSEHDPEELDGGFVADDEGDGDDDGCQSDSSEGVALSHDGHRRATATNTPPLPATPSPWKFRRNARLKPWEVLGAFRRSKLQIVMVSSAVMGKLVAGLNPPSAPARPD